MIANELARRAGHTFPMGHWERVAEALPEEEREAWLVILKLAEKEPR